MKTIIDKYFEAVDYYKEWREKLIRDKAIDYLKKINPILVRRSESRQEVIQLLFQKELKDF